ncbi:MAG: hypothetical protein ACOC1K_02100 [Nanoarchaeota archaeon]
MDNKEDLLNNYNNEYDMLESSLGEIEGLIQVLSEKTLGKNKKDLDKIRNKLNSINKTLNFEN